MTMMTTEGRRTTSTRSCPIELSTPEVLGTQDATGPEGDNGASISSPARPTVTAWRGRLGDPDETGHGTRIASTRTTGPQPAGKGAAGGDLGGLAGLDDAVRYDGSRGGTRPIRAKEIGLVRIGPKRLLAQDRVTVHRRPVEGGTGSAARIVGRKHATRRRLRAAGPPSAIVPTRSSISATTSSTDDRVRKPRRGSEE